jgi:hypothetical protein
MGLFTRRPKQVVPGIAPTGHAGDDALLVQISSVSDLDTARHWVHYLYVPDEPRARSVAEVVSAAGWDVQQVDESAAGGPEWVVVVERHGAVTSPFAVRDARLFFEGVAATHDGEYDGWEASL